MTTISMNKLAKRHVEKSHFSHFEGTNKELLKLVEANFHLATVGYRDGVLVVPVPPQKFYSPVTILKEGDVLEGTYQARQSGEEPRKSLSVVGRKKTRAAKVCIILYAHELLKQNDEHSSFSEWEVISINAQISEEPEPLSPETLIANHFVLSGGTSTLMSDEEFVSHLRESVAFWSNKALCSVSGAFEALTAENLLLKRRIGDVEARIFNERQE